MVNVLNGPLYEILQRRFGNVRVVHPGEQRIVRYVPHPDRAGRIHEQIIQRGEQYHFNCPFCGETRGRLYVSYQYGQPDVQGRPNYALFYCQNDTKCHAVPGVRDRFRSMAAIPFGYRARVRAGIVATDTSNLSAISPATLTFDLPDQTVPLTDLPTDHPALAYLRGRGFSPEHLAATWDIRYVPAWSSAASDRILIPIYRPEPMFGLQQAEVGAIVLAGWQGRYIGEPPDKRTPKYLFPEDFPKSKLLYGLVQAKQSTGPVAICEGVTDVWCCYPGAAVAAFGNAVLREQQLLLVHHFPGRPLVVMLDADAADAAHKLARDLRQLRAHLAGDKRVVVAQLPAGRSDPGACTHEELRACVWAALEGGT